MAKNVAARRAAKAQRRKSIVAEKRRTEIDLSSMAGQVRLAAAEPIQHCMISGDLFETGMGILMLARGPSTFSMTAGIFLLDTFALGVKDVHLRGMDSTEFAELMNVPGLVPAEPAYARKLLHDLVAWSRSVGVSPHRDYAKIEALFGKVDANTNDVEFTFGKDGKALFVGDLSDIGARLTKPGKLFTIEDADDASSEPLLEAPDEDAEP